MFNLIYFHYGEIPEYIYDNIFQVCLININLNIYIIIKEEHFSKMSKTLNKLNFKNKNNITLISIEKIESELENNINFNKLSKIFDLFNIGFRDGFWKYTLFRFIYINEFIKLTNIKNIFHIENDVMMYESFNKIYEINSLDKSSLNKLWVVQDSNIRVIPSLLFFQNSIVLNEFIEYIYSTYNNQSNIFLNDMDLLGKYPNKLKHFLLNNENESNYIYDGACLGQYIAGIDLRNSLFTEVDFVNPTKNFINETSDFKPNNAKFKFVNEKNLYKPKMYINNKTYNIVNLHIHSKDLYKYSSKFNFKYSDIITGDRITSLCDFVLCTREIYHFHSNLNDFAKDILIINDWENIKYEKINEVCKKLNKKHIRIFIYTHMLEKFQEKLLNQLDNNYNYIYYIHNSDHSFNNKNTDLLNNKNTLKVFSQNIDHCIDNKLSLLPIGIANNMWLHGDLNILYKQMGNLYKFKKQNNIYININPSTYNLRQELLEEILNNINWKKTLSKNKQYKEYICELSLYRFCLCIRGNGLDTHRFWESLYLGVIPVILDHPLFKLNNFIKYIKKSNIPCLVLKTNNFYEFVNNYKPTYFNEELYNKINKGFCNDILKLKHYTLKI